MPTYTKSLIANRVLVGYSRGQVFVYEFWMNIEITHLPQLAGHKHPASNVKHLSSPKRDISIKWTFLDNTCCIRFGVISHSSPRVAIGVLTTWDDLWRRKTASGITLIAMNDSRNAYIRNSRVAYLPLPSAYAQTTLYTRFDYIFEVHLSNFDNTTTLKNVTSSIIRRLRWRELKWNKFGMIMEDFEQGGFYTEFTKKSVGPCELTIMTYRHSKVVINLKGHCVLNMMRPQIKVETMTQMLTASI